MKPRPSSDNPDQHEIKDNEKTGIRESIAAVFSNQEVVDQMNTFFEKLSASTESDEVKKVLANLLQNDPDTILTNLKELAKLGEFRMAAQIVARYVEIGVNVPVLRQVKSMLVDSPAYNDEHGLSSAVDLIAEGKYEEAIKILEKSIELNSDGDISRQLMFLMQSFEATNNPEKEMECLIKLAELEPEKPAYQELLAIKYRELGQIDDAIRHLNRAIEKGRSTLSHKLLASIHIGNQQTDEAIRILEQCDGDLNADILLAGLYMANGQTLKSSMVSEKYIDFRSDDPKAYFSVGHMWYVLGNFDRGMQYIKKCLQLDPVNEEALDIREKLIKRQAPDFESFVKSLN